jgi:hypothetical protein
VRPASPHVHVASRRRRASGDGDEGDRVVLSAPAAAYFFAASFIARFFSRISPTRS